jgi:hypothetical protein
MRAARLKNRMPRTTKIVNWLKNNVKNMRNGSMEILLPLFLTTNESQSTQLSLEADNE